MPALGEAGQGAQVLRQPGDRGVGDAAAGAGSAVNVVTGSSRADRTSPVH